MSKTSSSKRPPRPKSAVSTGVGMAGLAGLAVWLGIALTFGMDGPYSALMNVAFCGGPMMLWSLIIDRVHRNPTTGIDWDSEPRPVRTVLEISLTKLAGLWATWALIAAIYAVARFYWQGNYLFAMKLFASAALPLFLLSIPYVIWLDRRLIEPRDGAWALGAMMMGREDYDASAIHSHFRSWAVKGFFLAFMISIVPSGFGRVINADFGLIQSNPVALVQWLITLMFVIDVAFATVGYLLTLKPLDAHIRSATPYAAGWAAALMCYPPFILMNPGGPLDYQSNDNHWIFWLEGHPVLLGLAGTVLVGLTAIYAWATIAFGLRFSNLTDRGILTHGPYAFTKHPAYLSKNLFWWLSSLPFLMTGNTLTDTLRNTALLAVVSGVYFWRAKTEELHLGADPDYRDYADWMGKYGVITRALTWRRVRQSPSSPASVAKQ